jgi:hypothetical protein
MSQNVLKTTTQHRIVAFVQTVLSSTAAVVTQASVVTADKEKICVDVSITTTPRHRVNATALTVVSKGEHHGENTNPVRQG